ncbi:MAG: hypothetical protein PHP08_04330 [Candidatus Dojkabacteria bacterium]|nr:hypothetical protein [Candidatus Dojkabacteria bacterium]
MGILNALFGDSSNSITFYKLYNNLKNWKQNDVFPFTYNLPQSISFPDDFWKRIISIHKNTLRDGNERAISIYWADGELVVSPITTGDSKSVSSRGGISVKYEPHPTKKDYLRKEVILNSSLYKRLNVYSKNIPKKIEVSYLFNMHTHPQHRDNNGVGYYNFFSAQDIKSFINSNVAITGLITDKLWMLIRTNRTPKNLDNLQDKDITVEKLKELEIGIYSGEFNKNLTKI